MKTILFADDDRAVREFCRRLLEDEGYRVVLAQDGVEAIALLESANPDVAVLDIHMPRKGGLETVEHISVSGRNIPVILFTANDDMCVHDPRARLAMACVEKSFDLTELKLALVRILAATKAECAFPVGLPPVRPVPESPEQVR
jgi:CheY-like chemotaxis protein